MEGKGTRERRDGRIGEKRRPFTEEASLVEEWNKETPQTMNRRERVQNGHAPCVPADVPDDVPADVRMDRVHQRVQHRKIGKRPETLRGPRSTRRQNVIENGASHYLNWKDGEPRFAGDGGWHDGGSRPRQ